LLDLGKLGDRRAIPYIIAYAQTAVHHRPEAFFALTHFNCEESLPTLLTMALDEGHEVQEHMLTILDNLQAIDEKRKNFLLNSLQLVKTLTYNQKNTDINKLYFIENCIGLLERIPSTKLATVLPFKRNTNHHAP
jgi:hypothetical protein